MPPAQPLKNQNNPDFRHVETWIFDLDNTLYRADSDLFAQIDARMTAFIVEALDMPPADARKLQKDYYRDHGTTLGGLMRHHAVAPDAFLAFVHDIDLDVLSPDADLIAGIAALPGRRIVFTNGCHDYARRVLDRTGLGAVIDDVWDIRRTGFVPKPEAGAYDAVVRGEGVTPGRAAMFEDIARNLVAAHALGMTTVWLNNNSVWSRQGPQFPLVTAGHVHHETDDLGAFLRGIRI